MNPAPLRDLAFQDTGIWMWLAHAAMSAIFAVLLGAMYLRLRRPLMGWLACLFLARTLLGGSAAAYWAFGFSSTFDTTLLVIVMGSTLAACVPLLHGAMRTLTARGVAGLGTFWVWLLVGGFYSVVVAVLGQGFIDRSDIVTALLFRPLILTTGLATILVVLRRDDMLRDQQPVHRIMQVGVGAYFVMLIAESYFRTRVATLEDPAFALTATLVSNLSGLLVLGIASLLAVVAAERIRLEAVFAHEVLLTRRGAEAARLESLGRLASGIAQDFNGLLDEVDTSLRGVRAAWQEDPQRALACMDGVRAAVDRGGQLTKRLLSLARQQEMQRRSFAPAQQLRDLLKVLTRTMSRGHVLEASVAGANHIVMAPAQFDQLVLNLVLSAHEMARPDSTISLTLEDVRLEAERSLSDGVCRPGLWVRMAVQCEPRPRVSAAVTTLTRDGSEGGASAARVSYVEHGTAFGHAAIALIAAEVGGQVHVEADPTRAPCMAVWLPALPSVTVTPDAPTPDLDALAVGSVA